MIAMKTIDFGVARPESSKGVESGTGKHLLTKTQKIPFHTPHESI